MEVCATGELYSHLIWRERLRIKTRLKDGWKSQKIADKIGRHVSTIYWEIKRGLGVQRTTDLIDLCVLYTRDRPGQIRGHILRQGPGPQDRKGPQSGKLPRQGPQGRLPGSGGRPRGDCG
ncbi:helix-turn-helix domain-containing protein [uncultured Oscillibacter sp.]|uniref:helix-turn-helix domain-containing protein n=1 Tax=uncultured Oscillibacter sp. TaxID=876091 RepID=UPI0034576BF3